MSESQRKPRLVVPPSSEALAVKEHAKAMNRVADSLGLVAAEMKMHREQAKPVHEFYSTAGEALTCARASFKKWGPWLLASTPFVVSLVNGISPQAAKLIQFIVTSIGNAPQ